MPAKSGKQYRFMQAIAHGAEPKSGNGPSQAVAKEFVAATPKRKKKPVQGPGSRVLRD